MCTSFLRGHLFVYFILIASVHALLVLTSYFTDFIFHHHFSNTMASKSGFWLRWESICPQCGRPRLNPWIGKIPWKRKWQPAPVLLPRKLHGWKSLLGYSPWGREESDTTGWFHVTSWSLRLSLITFSMRDHGFLFFPKHFNNWKHLFCWYHLWQEHHRKANDI